MQYISFYESPLGRILLSADECGLTGLWFEGQKYYARNMDSVYEEAELPIIQKAKEWLDIYFSGKEPKFSVPVHLVGTNFQMEVWEMLCEIPYGETTTYGALAKKLVAKRGIKSMSAQAVGGAVGRNPISIIVPCHRVVGADGSLTGYAGGLDKKVALLELEISDE